MNKNLVQVTGRLKLYSYRHLQIHQNVFQKIKSYKNKVFPYMISHDGDIKHCLKRIEPEEYYILSLSLSPDLI